MWDDFQVGVVSWYQIEVDVYFLVGVRMCLFQVESERFVCFQVEVEK